MPARWKFFIIANYLNAVVFLLIFLFALRAYYNPYSGMRNLDGGRLLTLCVAVILLNSLGNILLFHRHIRGKALSKETRMFCRVSNLFSAIAVLILLLNVIPELQLALNSAAEPSYIYFIVIVTVCLLILLFILFLQYKLPGAVEKLEQDRISQQITDIGNDEQTSQ